MKRKVVILGGAESGVGAAILAKSSGYSVFLSDNGIIPSTYKTQLNRNKIDFEEGYHSDDAVLDADEIVKSPGIPDNVNIVQIFWNYIT